jgi:hypothetical protein
MRKRVNMKSPVRENRPPGSVRGAPGNWCPYLDIHGREKNEKSSRKTKIPLDSGTDYPDLTERKVVAAVCLCPIPMSIR